MSFVTGVDFVAIQVQDHDRAAKFYGETLGLPFVKQWGKMPASEYQAGNLTLAVMQSDAFGLEFRTGSTLVALQVDDVAATRERLEAEGIAVPRRHHGLRRLPSGVLRGPGRQPARPASPLRAQGPRLDRRRTLEEVTTRARTRPGTRAGRGCGGRRACSSAASSAARVFM